MKGYAAIMGSGLLLLAASAAWADADFAEPVESEHFAIFYRLADFHAGPVPPERRLELRRKVTTDLLERLTEWLEHSYQVEIVQYKLKPPEGRKVRGRFPVALHDFGDAKLAGYVRYNDCILHLNLRTIRERGRARCNLGKLLMPATVCHEFFHAIQASYDKEEERWLVESTAQWMETEVWPDLHDNARQESLYQRSPYLSLHHLPPGDEIQFGRPYGASIFFRFLSRHHPDGPDVMRQIWARCEARAGQNSLEAVIETVNRRGPEQFRDYFQRFAAGSLLLEQAPDNCRLADAELLARAARTDLSSPFSSHYGGAFHDPGTAALTLRFDGDAEPLRAEDGSVAGLGTRYFRIERPANVGPGSALFAVVAGPPRELAVQAMAKFDGKWKVVGPLPGDDASQGCAVRVDDLDKAQTAVFLAVSRLDARRDAAALPLRIAVAAVPCLREATIVQKDQPVVQVRWLDSPAGAAADKRVANSVVSRGVRQADGPATIRLTFSRPVRARASRPLVQVDRTRAIEMSSADGGIHWSGSVGADLLAGPSHGLLIDAEAVQPAPASAAVMPLDRDPVTPVALGMADWAGYERQGAGMYWPLPAPAEGEFRVKPTLAFRKGPLIGSVGLYRTDNAAWEQPYIIVARLGPHVRYIYGSNAKAFGGGWGGRRTTFEQFHVPARTETVLPDNMELLAEFADGTRIAGKVPIAYEGDEPDWVADHRRNLQDAQAKYRQAQAMPAADARQAMARRNAMLASGLKILEHTMDSAEARRLRPELEKVTGAASPTGVWTAMMKGSFCRRDAKTYLEMLEALRDAGSPPEPGHYLECMGLLVSMNNDVASARRVWRFFKDDGPKWPDAVRKRYHYDETVAGTLALPDEAFVVK